ncbi:RdgB/HAM1 family non-canonical purine NTP pyrophosphatase [Candidatus Bipolaricaulota bacterium]|nr:RdgB/HAM1 family non-canonical purine NTP pyrophosphatase [Candidatus Bipolaricaulota bacterium]
MRLLLGTQNEGKIEEAKGLLSGISGLELLTFVDEPFSSVDETGETFLANALLKAQSICLETGMSVLSEDAGLEVAALDGAPGVRSARFSGEPVDYQRNNELLLSKLAGIADRRARFVAVAALCTSDGQTFVSTGLLRGTIATACKGSGGFGYDPLFVPEGETRTLAQMSLDEKNRMSHRKHALSHMRSILIRAIERNELRVE